VKAETFVRAHVAGFCITEAAHHGGVKNMLAVAHVLRNRVMDGWGDWYEVWLTAPAKRGAIYEAKSPDLRNSQVRLFLQRVDGIFDGTEEEDPTNGALYYTEAHLPQTLWFRESILANKEDFRKVAQVGSVWFFKGVE
jgi:hypothetical protein